MEKPLREQITQHGQPYVDEPIFVRPRPPNPLQASVGAALGVKPDRRDPVKIGHDRVRLRWMKPDGKGGLVPQ